MKITKEKLNQIIKEEFEAVLAEGVPLSPREAYEKLKATSGTGARGQADPGAQWQHSAAMIMKSIAEPGPHDYFTNPDSWSHTWGFGRLHDLPAGGRSWDHAAKLKTAMGEEIPGSYTGKEIDAIMQEIQKAYPKRKDPSVLNPLIAKLKPIMKKIFKSIEQHNESIQAAIDRQKRSDAAADARTVVGRQGERDSRDQMYGKPSSGHRGYTPDPRHAFAEGKITKEKLNQIIKEEFEATVEEGFFSKLFNRPDKRWAVELKKIDKAMDRAKKDSNDGDPPRYVLEAIEEIEAAMAALQGGEPNDAQIEERDNLRRELKAFRGRQEDKADYAAAEWESNRQRGLRRSREEFERKDREAQAEREREAQFRNKRTTHRSSSRYGKYDPGDYRDGVFNVGNLEETITKALKEMLKGENK